MQSGMEHRLVSSLCRAETLLTNQLSNADRCLLGWILSRKFHRNMEKYKLHTQAAQFTLEINVNLD